MRMNTSNMSDTEILELFENSFKEKIAEPNNIDEPEFQISRSLGSNIIRVFVNLYGMAGSPTIDTYKDTQGVDTLRIFRADKGTLNFRLVPRETRTIGGNEYQVVYDSE